jgi:hypothetical protein
MLLAGPCRFDAAFFLELEGMHVMPKKLDPAGGPSRPADAVAPCRVPDRIPWRCCERANGSAAAPRRSSATTRCRPRKYAALPVNAVGIGFIRVSAANRRRSGRASPTSKHGTSPLTPIPPSKSRYRGAVARPPADGPFSRRQIGPSPLDAEGLAQLFVEDSAGSKATHRAELAG